MGEPERGGPWFCGPEGNRRAYLVDDITGIEGGQGFLVRAERRSFVGDPVGFAGVVSLKLLTDLSEARVATLRERWELLAGLRHPSLARPLEVFEGPGLSRTGIPEDAGPDVCYVASEWVDGSGLREVAPLPPAGAFRLASDLAAGIAELHRRKIVHRDLHPGNVIVTPAGAAVLIDFGSARPDDGSATTTVSGVLGFIPPDSVREPGTAASDRWGLGMLVVFALLGHSQGPMTADRLRTELAGALDGIAQPRRAARLLGRMVDPDPRQRPDDAVRWARELTDTLARGPRRRRLVAATAVGLLGIAGVGAAALQAGTADDAPRPSADGPAAPTSCPRPSTTEPTDDAIVAAVERMAGDDCLAGAAEEFVEAVVQPLETPAGEPAGVVLLSPSGTSVRLTQAMWGSYREIVSRSVPENSVTYGGYPVAVERLEERDAVSVRLDEGGLLLGLRDDTQLFWVPRQVMELWLRRGGVTGDLGLPTSNPYYDNDGLHLDFEHGTMHAFGDEEDVASILAGGPVANVVVELHDESEALRVGLVTERIVRQSNGTAWWVDRDRVRHWIADGETWSCLGGDDGVALDDLHGWEIAVLSLGPPASCPDP